MTPAMWTAGAWLLLCFTAANVWVAVANYRKAGELDAKENRVDCEHLRNLAVARLLENAREPARRGP